MGEGYHGNFGHTKGSTEIIPINKLNDVLYCDNKMTNYLLNVNHEQGKSKAKFFIETLGFSKKDGETLHNAIVNSIIGKYPDKCIYTSYGLKVEYHTTIYGKNGRAVKANIVAILQKDVENTKFKIITVYPDKKVK